MINFGDGAWHFRCRTAAIIRRDGHVLVHRAMGEEGCIFPGGRVELGETSAVALGRELSEELGVEAEVGPLAFVLESFFPELGRRMHEIGLYYWASIPSAFPFIEGGVVCHSVEDGGVTIEFAWVKNDPASLAAATLYPIQLRDRLSGAPGNPVHLVTDEP